MLIFYGEVREAPKKVLLLMAGPLRGGGGRAGPLREKEIFLTFFFQYSNISTAIKLETGGGKRSTFFCGFPKWDHWESENHNLHAIWSLLMVEISLFPSSSRVSFTFHGS